MSLTSRSTIESVHLARSLDQELALVALIRVPSTEHVLTSSTPLKKRNLPQPPMWTSYASMVRPLLWSKLAQPSGVTWPSHTHAYRH